MRAIDDIITVTIELAPGRYAFRYLADDGEFFDELGAHAFEANGYGQTHSVLVLESAPATPATDRASGPDNLVAIVGIGPKIAGALIASGITTFADLATISVHEIRAALDAAGIRLAPSIETWSSQAATFATAGATSRRK